MIWESGFWKDELHKQAQILRRKKEQRRWPDRSSARMEQLVMLGFYSIRKLLEAKKLTQDLIEERLSFLAFPWNGRPVTLLNHLSPEKAYDFDKPLRVTQGLKWLSDLVVHSFVFTLLITEDGFLEGFLVNSDRTRHVHVYLITVDQVIAIFEMVAEDEANYAEYCRIDPKTSDYHVVLRRDADRVARKRGASEHNP